MSNPEKKIKWDEEVISLHNQERGTRQKIDEPPTPFAYGIDESGNETTNNPNHDITNSWEEIHAKLHYEAEKQKLEELENLQRVIIGEPKEDEIIYNVDNVDNINNSKDNKDNNNNNNNNNNTNKTNFAQKRASHYNEYNVLKAMRSVPQNDEDDEDDNRN